MDLASGGSDPSANACPGRGIDRFGREFSRKAEVPAGCERGGGGGGRLFVGQFAQDTTHAAGGEALLEEAAPEQAIAGVVGKLGQFAFQIPTFAHAAGGLHASDVGFQVVGEETWGEGPKPTEGKMERAGEDVTNEAFLRNFEVEAVTLRKSGAS